MRLHHRLRDYLIPHRGNNYKPSFFSTASLVAIVAVVLVCEGAYLFHIKVILPNTSFLSAVLPGVLVSLVNVDRAEAGAREVRANGLLTEAARLAAEDMAEKGYFAHVSPSGEEPWVWLDLVGYRYSYAGQNLAVNFTDSLEVEEAWMSSPTHRANILKNEYTEVGIALAQGSYHDREATFVVQFFARPVQDALPSAPLPARELAALETPLVPTVLAAEIVLTSPNRLIESLILALLILVLGLLVLAVIVKIRIQHRSVITGGLTLIALILALFLFNGSTVTPVELPPQAASAVTALPSS